VVRINDRGLFVKNRLIDLSQVAAQQLQFSGFVRVSLEIVRTHE
jgi:rare lipoprotein A